MIHPLPIGTRVSSRSDLYTITAARPDDSGAVRLVAEGGPARITWAYDCLTDSGAHVSGCLNNTDFTGRSPALVRDDLPRATAEEIAAGIAAARTAIEEAKAADARAAEEHAAEVSRLRSAPEFAHLSAEGGRYRPTSATAANIRAHLKKTFPGQKIRVTSSRDSVRVSWIDGPTVAEIKAAIGPFETYAGADWSGDYPEFHRSAFTEAFGGARYVFPERTHSDAALAAAIDKVWPGYDWQGASKPTVAEYRRDPFALVPRSFHHMRGLAYLINEELEAAA